MHTRTPWGSGSNVLSAVEIDTGSKMSDFDKPLKPVTSAAVTNWRRQKEELIRSDFLSYKSGVTTGRAHTSLSRARVHSAPAVQSEWLVLGINDIETHKTLQSALSKVASETPTLS